MTVPAPRMYVDNGEQMTLRLNQNGQPAVVVLGARRQAASDLTADVANAWRDAAWTAFRQLLVYGVTCTGATVRYVGLAEGTVVEVGPPGSNANGTQAGASALAASSALLKWTTARGGRSGKGRTYLPGIAADAVDPAGRAYSSGFAGSAQSAINAYLASAFWASNSRVPAVLSFTKGYATPITGGALATVVGVQRRRMR